MAGDLSDRLFLIDGYALIYRAFFAMVNRPLRTNRGENTSAVWGVANFLHRLLERHKPSHIAWVHDAGKVYSENRETNRIHVYEKKWNLGPDNYEAVW